jgi:Tol biopolymer transport system component/serine/threonine protein kinase
MTPERWQQVERLYQAALEREPSQRAAFLQEACAGDEGVRQEVESLLAYEPQAEGFIEAHALQTAAQGLSADQARSLAGGQIGSFKVLSLIGAGGMGEVYRARDIRLGREVAVKVLPAEVASDRDRLRRFLREARSASTLNHPNVATIHEIGEADGVHFIAMEYVEGQTLAAKIAGRPLETAEIVEIAVQVADALEEAHSRGITHRDIKPANLMLKPRGQVKVLDFGLAKVTGPAGQAVGSDLSTVAKTETGVVLGTLQYMSPEQLLGKEVDHRTDLFSFGVVLYEMATGRQPFSGHTSAAVFDAILHKAPSSPVRLNPEVPPELERIIRKALEKDREVRYQHASELRADLRRLQRDISSGQAVDPASTPPAAARLHRGRGRWVWGLGAAALAGVIGTALWLYIFRPASQSSLPPAPKVVRFTSYPGKEKDPALSPDGKQVAFVWDGDKGDNFDIYVQLIGGGPPLPLTADPRPDVSPAWSPDGSQIAFARLSEGASAIYLIPSLGGHERKLTELYSIWSEGKSLDWSPDGKFLVAAEKGSPEDPYSLFSISVETGGKQKLTSPPTQFGGDTAPVFSPDGQTLAFNRLVASNDLYLLPLTGGQPTRLTFDESISGTAWTPDGRELLYFSASWGANKLSRVSTSGGQPKELGISAYGGGSISHRANRLAYVEGTYDTDIWRIPVPGARGRGLSPAKLIWSSQMDDNPQYSPDGQRIIFGSNRSGSYESWICDADGRNRRQLTSFPEATVTGSARWSPDGRDIAFNTWAKDLSSIFVVSAEGGSPRRLTEQTRDGFLPAWSKDGRWIYFCSNRSGDLQIWKMPAQGGRAVRVTKKGGFEPLEAADGKTLYYTKLDRLDATSGSAHLWKMSVEGGEETRVLERTIYPRYWAITDRGIYFVPSEWSPHPAIELFSFATGRATRVISLDKPPVGNAHPGLSVSPDGRWILCALLEQDSSDIMLVENFR